MTPLSGDADRELLAALVGERTLPLELEERILDAAAGSPFFLEELVSSLVDGGRFVRDEASWRFDHDVAVEVPPTVERVILARVDRLAPSTHELLIAASVLGRQFNLPLLAGVSGDGDALRSGLSELQRLDVVREARRWPQPEYQFKHALIQETVYRTVLDRGEPNFTRRQRNGSRSTTPTTRTRCTDCSRTTGSRPTTRTRRSRTSPEPATKRDRSMRSTRRSSTTAALLAAPRGARRAAGDRPRALQTRARSPHGDAVRRVERDLPAPRSRTGHPRAHRPKRRRKR